MGEGGVEGDEWKVNGMENENEYNKHN